ncbi:hypothetical protein [Bacillus timonensis]|uniref:hypothetical protein n=1 Tax=Bacillus timonensis TaxID=1033734 RepID=UPI000287A89F|nr:hypothetical protein [Bacillus timonensis]
MIPINIIQALFKSGALQKLHSLPNTNQNEQKSQHPSTSLSNIIPIMNNDIIENASQHSQIHQTDKVELTLNDSSQYIQHLIIFQNQDFKKFSIQMSGRKKSGKINPDFCRLLFSLELENLSEVVIDVKVQNRILSIVIFNQAEGIESLVNDLRTTLQESFESLGYKLSSIKIGKSTTKDSKVGQADLTRFHERVDFKI